MQTIIQLLRSKTIWFAILLAILPLFAQYIGAFNLTPMEQMIALRHRCNYSRASLSNNSTYL